MVADNYNGKMMYNLQPSTELHSKGCVQANNILDPSQCTPSQPTHLSGVAAANLVKLSGVGEVLLQLLDSVVLGSQDMSVKVRDPGIIKKSA